MENMTDKIYIIGAGAVGMTLAVALKSAHKEVIIIRGGVDDKPSYVEKIKVLLDHGKELEAKIEVSTLSKFSELKGIIVLTNKSYGNKDLSVKLKEKTGNSPIVILQNGLGIEQPFIDQGFNEIYRCVLFVTCEKQDKNKVSYKPVAISPIGAIKSSVTDAAHIVSKINSAHFQFRVTDDIQKTIWEKAIANSVFNSICPLLEIDNGIFHRKPSVFNLAKRIIAECTLIAKAKGIHLKNSEIEERVLLISKMSDGQIISTLQDIRNGRQTEISTLNLEFSRIAKELHKEALATETKLLGELTALKSELAQARTTNKG